MSIHDSVKAAAASASKLLGCSIEMVIARCPAWGSDDCCVLVKGERHFEAAAAFCRAVPDAKIEVIQAGGWRGSKPYSYSSVSFPSKKELSNV